MPRVEWSFFLPAEDHRQVKWLLTYGYSRLTGWGLALGLVTFIGSSIASVGTHISAYLLPCFIAALFITSYFLSLFFRPKVDAQRFFPSQMTAGQEVVYQVAVKNTGRRAVRNLSMFEQALPYGLYSAVHHPRFSNTVARLDPAEQKILTLVIRAPRRGCYELLPLVAGSSFPSGIMRSRVVTKTPAKITVYPLFTRPAGFKPPLHRQFQPGGLSLSSKVGDSNEFASTREFHQGDRLRDVHWASSARAGKLIVKEYIEEYFVRVGLFLDTELKRFEKHGCFEARISLCAGLADALNADDYILDVFLSTAAVQRLEVGRGLGTLDHLLEQLSAIEGDFSVDFARQAVHLEESVRDLSLLIVLLKDWDENRKHFFERLERTGFNIRGLIIRDQKTSLPVNKENISVYRSDQLASIQ